MLTRKMLPALLLLLCTTLHAQYWWGRANNRIITTDYNTCLKGVKDTLGNWVIPAQYEEINTTDEFGYIVGAGGRFGIIDTNGRQVIPMMYDNLRDVNRWDDEVTIWDSYYYVWLNDRCGVIDTLNHVFVPIEYEDIESYSDSTFLAGDSRGNWDVYHPSGQRYRLPWKSKWEPDHELDHTYIVKRKKFYKKWRYGLANDTGGVMLERKYSNIHGNYQTNTFGITRKGKKGFISRSGQVLWPMVFSTTYRYNWYRTGVGPREIGVAIVDDRSGLVSIYGDTLLPFVYQDIQAFDDYHTSTLWKVSSGWRTGLYDEKLGWVLPMDTAAIYSVRSWTVPQDSSTVGLLVTQRNGYWGALLTNGQIIVPFTNESMLKTGSEYVFKRGDSLFALGLNSYSERSWLISRADSGRSTRYASQWEGSDSTGYISRDKRFEVFQGKYGTVAWYNPTRTHDAVSTYDTSVTLNSGSYYETPLPDSIYMATEIYVRPVTGIVAQGKYFYLFDPPNLFEGDSAYASYAQVGLIWYDSAWALTSIEETIPIENGPDYYITTHGTVVKQDGTTLLSGDTLSSVYYVYRESDGHLFFKTYNRGSRFYDTTGKLVFYIPGVNPQEFSDNYYWCRRGKSYNFSILHSAKTGNILPTPESQYYTYHPIWDSITILENEEEGLRLYDIKNEKFLSPPGMNIIAPMNPEGTLFSIRTCSGNIGIVNSGGDWIADTLYRTLVPIDSDTSFDVHETYGESMYDVEFYHHWIIANRDTSIGIDVDHKSAMSDSMTHKIIFEIVHYGLDSNFSEMELNKAVFRENNYDLEVRIFIAPDDSANLLWWQQKCILDSACGLKRSSGSYQFSGRYPCRYCKARGATRFEYEWSPYGTDRAKYALVYRSDSLISFSQLENESEYYGWTSQFSNHSNVMLFTDGPHQLLLDSLFTPTSDWRNFIINYVLNYVNNNPDVEGDCHNPAMIPTMMRTTFFITPAGLLIFPRGFRENWSPLQLTLTWKELDPYLRTDIKSRLPINEKQ